jgi:hypothetical protein
MKTKIWGLILILATLGVKNSTAQYAPTTTPYQLDTYPDAPLTISVTGDDGNYPWTSDNHGIFAVITLTVPGPDQYRKVVGSITTPFNVKYKAHSPTLSASGGNLQSGVYHVPQGMAVTITVEDSYFYGNGGGGYNFLRQGSTTLGSNQSIYSINGTGTIAYTWLAQDGAANLDTHSFTICWDAPPPTTYALTVQNGTGDGNYEAGTSVPISADAPSSGQQFKN